MSAQSYQFPNRHLLGIQGLSRQDIIHILDRAEEYVDLSRQDYKHKALLNGRTVINLFFEDSTRTSASFEVAAKRLGADVVNMSVKTSSVNKGETLIDTAATLNAMKPDILVIRLNAAGGVKLLSRKVGCHVINAGDGTHEHPTQALLDALAIRRRLGEIEGLKIAICGDVLHSRVARSNILLLHMLGADIRCVGPKTLVPSSLEDWGVKTFLSMEEGLADCDVVMMLRLQQERMNGAFVPSKREYFQLFGLTEEKLAHAKPNAFIMHPGPMNRGVEIESHLADHVERSLITHQVEMGVAIRMAVMDILTEVGRDERSRS